MIATNSKPQYGDPCNHCGYCCSVHPCELAQEVLSCSQGPCVALEFENGLSRCGLIRNPLGYLYQVAHPLTPKDQLDQLQDTEQGRDLSAQIARSLGAGKGCDSDDSEESKLWPFV